MPVRFEASTMASSSQPSPDSNGTSTPASRTCSINDTADRGMLAPYMACGLGSAFLKAAIQSPKSGTLAAKFRLSTVPPRLRKNSKESADGPRVDATFVDPKGYMSKSELVPCIFGHGKGLSVVAIRRKEHARADLMRQVRRGSARRNERDSGLLKYPPRVRRIGGIRVTNACSGVRIPHECVFNLVGRPTCFALSFSTANSAPL